MQPLVSIIIPVYNMELFLCDCLHNISNQSYKNFEVIIIDDGSTDNSPNIIKNYVKKESRAISFIQKNRGVAAAREVGHKLSKGKYVIHCDSDDYFTTEAIEKLVYSAEQNCSDIVVGNYYVKYKNKDVLIKNKPTNSILIDIIEGRMHGALWNKLIKRSIIGELSFEKNINYMEDLLFISRLLVNKSFSISFVDEPVYYYRMRKGSYTSELSPKSIQSVNKVFDIILFENKAELPINTKNIIKAKKAYFNLRHCPQVSVGKSIVEYIDDIKVLNLPWYKKVMLALILRRIKFPSRLYSYIKLRNFYS